MPQSQLKDLFIEFSPTNEEWENQVTIYGAEEINTELFKKNYQQGFNVKRFFNIYFDSKQVLFSLK